MLASACRAVLILRLLGVVGLLYGPPAIGATCPAGFTHVQPSCYELNNTATKAKWDDARQYCLDLGAHLPYVNNEVECRFLQGILKELGSTGHFMWLGLKVTEADSADSLVWEDGSAVTVEFALFSPDADYRCTVLRSSDGRLALNDCVMENHMICEASPVLEVETTAGTAPSITDEVTDATTKPTDSTIENATTTEYTRKEETEQVECHSLDCLKELIADDPANEENLKKVVEVCAQLLEADPTGPTAGTSQDEAARVTEVMEFLDETFSLVLGSLDRNKTTFSVTTRNIVFEANVFSGPCGDVSTDSGEGARHDVSLCTENHQGGHIGVGITCLPDPGIAFPLGNGTEEPDSVLGSCIVTLNVAQRGIAHSTAERAANATMTIAKTEMSDGLNGGPVCAFWRQSTNDSNGTWSEEGCHMMDSNGSHVICSCNHLTNFAVLVRITPMKEPFSDTHSNILEVLTVVGGVISIICLSVTLFLYIWLKVYRNQTLVIHANLAVSILISQVIFLAGIDATRNKAACKLVAVLLHYSLLSSFAWMMLEGANLHLKATSIFQTTIHTGLLFTIGWVSPLPIVGISLGVKFSTYTSKSRCWLNMEQGLVWSFVAPVILVILGNTCVLLNVIRVFLSLEAMADKPRIKRIMAGARAVLLLTPLLGITWLVGLFNVPGAELVVSYIFVILNSLQGVFIFFLHCVFNEEVGKAFQQQRAKHRRLHSSKIQPNPSPTSKDQDGTHSTKQSQSGKKNVAWACAPSTNKSCVISASSAK